jgi:hypothetical protein
VRKRVETHPDCPVCRYWLARAEEDRSHSLKRDKAKKELAEHLARSANMVKVEGDNANRD